MHWLTVLDARFERRDCAADVSDPLWSALA
jgi:hypothetical protein